MEPIRVLQVLDKISVNSGVWAVVNNYYSHMDNNEIVFDFMVNEQVDVEIKREIEKRGSRIYVMPALRLKNLISYTQELRVFFEEHKEYKIVHGHVPNASAFYLSSAKKAGIPIRIIHSHNSKGADGTIKKARNYLLNHIGVIKANEYFACSDLAANYLYGRKKSREAIIINNAIDLKKFTPDETVRRKMKTTLQLEGKTVIGHIGRFCEQKNQKFLIEVLKLLVEQQTDACLLLIGSGEQRTEIEKLAQKYRLERSVLFVGSTDKVKDYMQCMDMLLLPSLYEGLPVVSVEAQAAGLPCVLSDTITREVEITDQVYYLPLSDKEKWVEKINELIGMRKEKVENALFENRGFDIERESVCLANRYKELLKCLES